MKVFKRMLETTTKWVHPLEEIAKSKGYVMVKTFNKKSHNEGRTYQHPVTHGKLDVYQNGLWRHVNSPGSITPFISMPPRFSEPSWD